MIVIFLDIKEYLLLRILDLTWIIFVLFLLIRYQDISLNPHVADTIIRLVSPWHKSSGMRILN